MTQLELFAGIGGFGLAGEWAGIETVCQVEIDPFCQKVLAKNFPNAQRHDDIHTFDGTAWRGRVDIVSGGFPCQPYSHAGKRNGNNDDRALWPEMLRVIREVEPAWVVGENVAGLLSMDGGRVFDGIVSDLENAGYTVEAFVIPACAVGAPHRRDRVWIVANAQRSGLQEWVFESKKQKAVVAAEMGCKGIKHKKFEARHGCPGVLLRHYGLSRRVDEPEIIALGNAIVPQVAYQIFNAIVNAPSPNPPHSATCQP